MISLGLGGLIVLSVLPGSTNSAITVDPGAIVRQAAERFFEREPQAAGLSIGVVHGANTHIFNFGTADRTQPQRPTSLTLYRIASITKTFTGTLLAQAVLENRLQLSDDIRKYLDGAYPNLEFDGHPIEIRDLVNHRSGLPFMLPDRQETLPGYNDDVIPWATRVGEILRNYTRRDFFADLHTVKLTAIPGTQFKYSNAGAILAGYILERIYQTPYEELVKRRIARPLKMRDTTITLAGPQIQRLVKGFDAQGRVVPDNPDQLQAAGALKSTVADLLKYVRWQIAESAPEVKLSHQPTFTQGNYSAGLNWQMLL